MTHDIKIKGASRQNGIALLVQQNHTVYFDSADILEKQDKPNQKHGCADQSPNTSKAFSNVEKENSIKTLGATTADLATRDSGTHKTAVQDTKHRYPQRVRRAPQNWFVASPARPTTALRKHSEDYSDKYEIDRVSAFENNGTNPKLETAHSLEQHRATSIIIPTTYVNALSSSDSSVWI